MCDWCHYIGAINLNRMIIPAEIKRLLTEIRRIGRETGIESRYVSDFNRLYRFYMEMEGPGPNEQEPEPAAGSKQANKESLRAVAASPQLQTYFEQQMAARERYSQRMEYYLLLKSFYNAFIFPLEQNMSIARSCKELGIEAIGFVGGKKITQLELEAFRSGDTERKLATMERAFQAIGQIGFQDNFNMNDFANANSDQN